MQGLLVFVVIASIVMAIANKKNKAQAQKRPTAPPPGAPASGAAPARTAQVKPSASAAPTARNTTLSQKPSAPGTSKWPWPAQNSAQPQKKAATPAYGGTPRYTHVVTSTLEGGHTHTESSMTGEESCPPPKESVAKEPQAEPAAAASVGGLLSFQPNSVLQGVLFAEILGKPKSQR